MDGKQVSLRIRPRAEREIRKNDRGERRMDKPTFKHMISPRRIKLFGPMDSDISIIFENGSSLRVENNEKYSR